MDETEAQISSHRSAILTELCGILTSTQNLVKELQALVVLTDPENGKLLQSQATAIDSTCVWKSLSPAAETDTDL